MGSTWGPSGSCWPQMVPMLVPWTLLSGLFLRHKNQIMTNTCGEGSATFCDGHAYLCRQNLVVSTDKTLGFHHTFITWFWFIFLEQSLTNTVMIVLSHNRMHKLTTKYSATVQPVRQRWTFSYRQISNISHSKSPNLNVSLSSCRRLCAIYWSHVLIRKWRCSWSNADIWVINSLITY